MYFVGSRNRMRSRVAAGDGQVPTVKPVMICTTFRMMSLATVGCCHLMNATTAVEPPVTSAASTMGFMPGRLPARRHLTAGQAGTVRSDEKGPVRVRGSARLSRVVDLTAVAAFTAAGLSLVNVAISARMASRGHREQWRREQERPIVARCLTLSADARHEWRNAWVARTCGPSPGDRRRWAFAVRPVVSLRHCEGVDDDRFAR